MLRITLADIYCLMKGFHVAASSPLSDSSVHVPNFRNQLNHYKSIKGELLLNQLVNRIISIDHFDALIVIYCNRLFTPTELWP